MTLTGNRSNVCHGLEMLGDLCSDQLVSHKKIVHYVNAYLISQQQFSQA
jgi:hypothetical protein